MGGWRRSGLRKDSDSVPAHVKGDRGWGGGEGREKSETASLQSLSLLINEENCWHQRCQSQNSCKTRSYRVASTEVQNSNVMLWIMTAAVAMRDQPD